MSDNDGAAARQTRAASKAPGVPSSAASLISCKSVDSKDGIHAVPSPTHTFDKNPPGRLKGQSSCNPARQGKAVLWSDEEIQQLQRLVPLHTNPKGLVCWGEVEVAWRALNLTPRTKGGLSSKWRDSKIKSAKVMESSSTAGQEDAVLISKSDVATSDIIADAGNNDNDNSVSVNPTVENPTQCTPAVLAEDEVSKIFRKQLKKARKIGDQVTLRKPPLRVTGPQLKPVIKMVDGLMKDELGEGKVSWGKLSILVYAGAMTVSEIENGKSSEYRRKRGEWFKRSYVECESLRRNIGKATSELNRRKRGMDPTNKQTSNIRMLKKKYKAETCVEITSVVECLKSRLELLRSRIELRKADERRMKIRRTPAKILLRGTAEAAVKEENPNIHQVRRFWKKIVGVDKPFNSANKQLVAWERSVNEVQGDNALRDYLNLDLWNGVVHKMKSWKAYGPDRLHGFWWKTFETANAALFKLAKHHIETGQKLPLRWITDGRVVLIFKSGSRSEPSNFRPIACLNTCYKLVTGLVSAYLDRHMRERNILPNEQIALRGGMWPCLHAHTLDQTLTADAQNQKGKPLSVAWIDYAKAFDSVPHSYILWLFNAVQVPIPLRKFLKSVIKSWRVQYETSSPGGKIERSNQLRIRSGVLQGDSFSPLLFCLAMAPISHAINSCRERYTTSSGKLNKTQVSLSHLFYMDDLKLYANSSEGLTKLKEVVASISKDICMELNVKKCAEAHYKPKRMLKDSVTSDIEPSTLRSIDFPLLDGESLYKYLGMEQKLGLQESKAWDRAEDRCFKIAHRLWDSDLTFRQKVKSCNTTIIPVYKYIASCVIKGSGKYASVLERGERLDRTFRKHLVEWKARYKANCVARLYLPVEMGGLGLKSIKEAIEEATIYSWAYLCTRKELKGCLYLFSSMANRGKRCVVSDAKSILTMYQIEHEIDADHSTVILNGTVFHDSRELARHVVELMRTANNTRRYEEWNGLELAGRVLRSSASIDKVGSFTWLKEGKLSSKAVRNVLAAQEGCLITRAHPSQSHLGDKSCRACSSALETTEHVLSCCPKWLPTLYVHRHDSAARNIHYRLCRKYGFTPAHYSQKVEPVLENDSIKLYWNQPIQTQSIIRHNKPDIVVFDKPKKAATIIEVAVSWFTGIEKQKEIKRSRYCVNGNWEPATNLPYERGDSLYSDLSSRGWKVTFVPIVIGTNGEILSCLKEDLMKIDGFDQYATKDCLERMQRSVVLGTSRIIQNHLASER